MQSCELFCILSPCQMWRRLPKPCRAVKETPKRRKMTTRTWVWIRTHAAKPQKNLWFLFTLVFSFTLLCLILSYTFLYQRLLTQDEQHKLAELAIVPLLYLIWKESVSETKEGLSLKFDLFSLCCYTVQTFFCGSLLIIKNHIGKQKQLTSKRIFFFRWETNTQRTVCMKKNFI